VSDCCPSSRVLRPGGCPSFYRPRREQFTCMPHYSPTCTSMANSSAELTAVLANPAPVEASWCVLCPHRSSFEGGGVALVDWPPWWANSRVPLTGSPYVAQWLLWQCLVPARPNSIGMSPQRPTWCGSGGDGRTGLTTMGMTDPAGLTSQCGPVKARRRYSRVSLAPL
jgi:hypothetical protein